MLVLVSQILLIALAISWLIHMLTIAAEGSIYFVENNPVILWTEISVSILITAFAIYILIIQIRRLGERRESDGSTDRRGMDRRSTDRRSTDRRSTDRREP
jgi:ABC-type nickel/cobalt efflux system permease component RcnA